MIDKDIEVIKVSKHYKSKESNSYYHFSCGEYYDPRKMNFGGLRIFNDTTIIKSNEYNTNEFIPQYNTNIEITFLVLNGSLDYRDELGNCSTISKNESFRVCAGRGLIYGIKYILEKGAVNFIEIWIFPKEMGHSPTFEKQSYSIEDFENKIYPIIKPNTEIKGALDYSIYISSISYKKEVAYYNDAERLLYLYVKEGKITINDNEEIDVMDSAKIKFFPTKALIIKNKLQDPATIILIDIPSDD